MRLLIVGADTPARQQLTDDLDTQGMEIRAVDHAGAIPDDQGYAAALLLASDPGQADDEIRAVRERLCDPMMVLLPEPDRSEHATTPDNSSHALAEALDAGADDAVTLPYDVEELFARVRCLIRRCGPGESSTIRFEELELNYDAHTVTRAGQAIRLTAKEFDLLTLFMTQPQRVLTREDIGKHAWDRNFDAFSNVIEVIVSRLRKKIDQPFDVPYLHTVVGRGYMMSVTPPTE